VPGWTAGWTAGLDAAGFFAAGFFPLEGFPVTTGFPKVGGLLVADSFLVLGFSAE